VAFAFRLDVDSALSLQQQRLLGRNLITVFFTVNTPRAFFFRRPRPCAAADTGKSFVPARHIRKPLRGIETGTSKKALLFSCILLDAAVHATSRHSRSSHCDGGGSDDAQPVRNLKKNSRQCLVLASHKSKCANFLWR